MGEIIVKQIKSTIGRTPNQRKNLRALGLRRIGAQRKHKDTPIVRGMIKKVSFLVEVKESQ
jgi:large subunit ribosomal protein L30